MDKIKDAFQNVRQDMEYLREEILFLRESLEEIRAEITNFNTKKHDKLTILNPTKKARNQTDDSDIQTHDYAFKALKTQISPFSIGNQGVPTDRQTDRQTDNEMQNNVKNNEIKDIIEILDSLDQVKKEIRLKFKRLTQQEFLVFSTLYQLEESIEVNYKILSKKLGLSESSIRDYIGKIMKKGIPVKKIRLNNKNIRLSISDDFKKIATLSTILQLRKL